MSRLSRVVRSFAYRKSKQASTRSASQLSSKFAELLLPVLAARHCVVDLMNMHSSLPVSDVSCTMTVRKTPAFKDEVAVKRVACMLLLGLIAHHNSARD